MSEVRKDRAESRTGSSRRGRRAVLQKGIGWAIVRGIGKLPVRGFSKHLCKGFSKGSGTGLGNDLDRGLGKARVRASGRHPDGNPGKGIHRYSGRATGTCPVRARGRGSGKGPARLICKGFGRQPARLPDRLPGERGRGLDEILDIRLKIEELGQITALPPILSFYKIRA